MKFRQFLNGCCIRGNLLMTSHAVGGGGKTHPLSGIGIRVTIMTFEPLIQVLLMAEWQRLHWGGRCLRRLS